MDRSPLERLEDEARKPPRPIRLKLGARELVIPALWEWPSWSLTALGDGDYDSWAEEVLDDDSWTAWNDADPTLNECTDLLARWQEVGGEDVGLAISLTSFLEEHCESVEADLRRWYQVGLTDLYRGVLSYRGLMVMITKLPQESQTQTALRDNPREDFAPAPEPKEQQFGPWSLGDFQRAALLDAINYLTARVAWGAGDKDYPRPEPLPKPGVRKAAVSELPPAARAYLEGLRATG